MNITEMADLNPYPAYKYSGNPWLGKVPIHWNTARLKQVCTQYALYGANVQASEYSESGIRFIRTTDITEEGDLKPEGVKVRPELVPEHILTDGDILLSRSGTIGRSFQYQAQRHGPCSYAGYLVRFAPGPNTRSIYLYLCTRTPAFQNAVQAVAISSTIENVNAEKYASITIPLPPLDEQAAIVRYLDGTDQLIRAYVSAKERLIALLEEERQAVIHQAVTRGLDPNVKLKPSGVEWLGDVPEHWETSRVGHFSEVGNGSTPSRGNAGYWDDGAHPWLNSSSVNQGIITKADQFVTDLALRECHLPRVRSGSVLVGITGQGRTRGMSAVLDIDATINQHMAFITPKTTRVSPYFLQMCLTAAYSELRAISSASGSTKAALTCEDIKHFTIALPPRDEQERLLKQIICELARVDTTISRAKRQIKLLEEYRTRLIADVVTGKIDVRTELPTRN